MSTEAMRAALEALTCEESHAQPNIMRAVAQTILRDALAQRADEPVAWAALLSVMLAQDLAEAKRLAGEALDTPRAAAPAAPTVKESLPVAPAAPAYVPLSESETDKLFFEHFSGSPGFLTIVDQRRLTRVIESLVVARMRGEK